MRLRRQGLAWCVLTDVRRDGLGRGLDVAGAAALQAATGLRLVASGGVSGLDDIARAKAAGLAGVIVGRALYEGRVSLQECIRLAQNKDALRLRPRSTRRPPRAEEER
jgi:phosphoribosylformimino-5-aminoimidazole carboxamide ribotide isomerase